MAEWFERHPGLARALRQIAITILLVALEALGYEGTPGGPKAAGSPRSPAFFVSGPKF